MGGKKGMLTMSEISCIKFLRNEKSYSINSISKALGINWRTAKKYADHDQVPREKTIKKWNDVRGKMGRDCF